MIAGALLAGCRAGKSEDTGPQEPTPIVAAELWETAADDPLPDHRPEGATCLQGSWYSEATGLEIDTTTCDYLNLSQPLLLDLEEGEPLTVLAWHQVLLPGDDGEGVGHMALLIDGRVAWELEVPIPAESTVYLDEVPAPADAAAGATVHLHLHNHGDNTWQLSEVTALR